MERFWIINLLLFQLSWLCAAFYTGFSILVIPVLLLLHFSLSPTPVDDFKVLALAPVGIATDKLLLELDLLHAGEGIFPIWLLLLWMMFIVSLNHSLKWLEKRSIVTLAVMGAIGGTSSYWGGIKAGVLGSVLPIETTLLFLMMTWSLLLPVLVVLKRQIIPPHTTVITR